VDEDVTMAAATNEQVPAELTAELVHSVFSNRVVSSYALKHNQLSLVQMS